MPNGFHMAQAQPLDYRALIAGAGAPARGFMGGIQQGMQMRAQMAEMAAAEAEREAAAQQATRQEEIDQLAMQAVQDPQAMEALLAVAPERATEMQEFIGLRAQQAADEEARKIEAIGSLGTLMVTGKKKNVRSTYERAVQRIRKENDDESADVGLPTRAEAKEMSDAELFSTMQNIGNQLEQYAMGPEKAAQLRLERTEAEEKRLVRAQKAAEEGKVKELPPIKDPSSGRKEFTGLSKKFIDVRDAYKRVVSSAQDPSPAGDMALITNYMKILDPGSTVRESEYATAANAAGWPERVRAQWNRLVDGETLTQKMRDDFSGRAKQLYEGAAETQEQLEKQYRTLAKKSKFDPNVVVIDFIGDLRKKKKKAPPLKPEQTAEVAPEVVTEGMPPAEQAAVVPGVPAAPGPAKIVTEQRQTPDGRTIVRYSDGTMAIF